jgi:hypothetical protein
MLEILADQHTPVHITGLGGSESNIDNGRDGLRKGISKGKKKRET